MPSEGCAGAHVSPRNEPSFLASGTWHTPTTTRGLKTSLLAAVAGALPAEVFVSSPCPFPMTPFLCQNCICNVTFSVGESRLGTVWAQRCTGRGAGRGWGEREGADLREGDAFTQPVPVVRCQDTCMHASFPRATSARAPTTDGFRDLARLRIERRLMKLKTTRAF